MTDPGEATTADQEPEVKPEVLQDLDVTDKDADDIRGGQCKARRPGYQYIPSVTLVLG